MPNVLRLEAALDVRCVGSTLELARRVCTSTGDVEVDGGEVKTIDSAGAQLLFSVLVTSGLRASWRLSAELERALTAMGFPMHRFSPRTP